MATLYSNPTAPARQVHLTGTHRKRSTLLPALPAALGRAELLVDLRGWGCLPVGAPLDAAFAKWLSETVEDLLLPGNEAKLTSVLRYHAIAGQVQARHEARASQQRSA